MKTGLTIRTVLIIGLLCTFEILSAPFDTGMIELQQPDETTFIGRIWGDEFFGSVLISSSDTKQKLSF